jgi:hypothetical protein
VPEELSNLIAGAAPEICRNSLGAVSPMPTFSLASIVIAVDVALSSMPLDVKAPFTVRSLVVTLPSDTALAVTLSNVAVPVKVGLEEGAANPKALWMAVNSVVNSAPLITLLGSFDGRLSFDPKLVVGVYVMDIRISVFLWKPTVGQWTYIRKAPEGAVVLRPYQTT